MIGLVATVGVVVIAAMAQEVCISVFVTMAARG
jgi:hypothetical protein